MTDDKIHSLAERRRKRQLLALVEGGRKRRNLPASRLVVDVDGTEVTTFVPDASPTAIPLEEVEPASEIVEVMRTLRKNWRAASFFQTSVP